MTDENRLESLKRELNALYGRSIYEPKTLTFIDNRRKMEDFKMNTNTTAVDAFRYTIQQDIYKALASSPTVTVKTENTENTETPKEKWVWVTGYKGLDKDMKARGDFQYEMDQLYIMPDGERVQACYGGFHLCLNLKDLYEYKLIDSGNRFFECKALVRESDLDEYGKAGFLFKKNKLAAKSIRLVRELSIDEILADVDGAAEWTQDVKELAIAEGIYKAKTEWKIIVMTRMGYARPLAEYIVNHCDGSGYDLAVALDAQEGISMDTKVGAIFSHI